MSKPEAEGVFEASSFEELEDLLAGTRYQTLIPHSLTLNFPISNSTFLLLSSSNLGAALHSLHIDFEPCQLKDARKSVIDTSKVVFPLLRKFILSCQPIKSIRFSASNFPALEELVIEQPSNHPRNFELDLPNLRTLHLKYLYVTETQKFGISLSRCPKLESFSSYKLWGLGDLPAHLVVTPQLRDWEMRRSDDLEGLALWAPRLQTIKLRSCGALNSVYMLDKLPPGTWTSDYQFSSQPSRYDVSFYCVDIPACHGNLLTNSRCNNVSDDMDDFQIF